MVLVGVVLAGCAGTAEQRRPAGEDPPRPTRYVDGTIMTWDPRSGGTLWVAAPERGRYLEVGAVGPSVVVANAGTCTDDALVETRPVGLDARTGEVRWRSRTKGSVVDPGTGSDTAIAFRSRKTVGLSAQSGEERWEVSDQAIGTNPSTVFMRRAGAPLVLEALDRATGESRWTSSLSAAGSAGSDVAMVASDARLTVIALGGFLGRVGDASGASRPFAGTMLFTLDTATGRELHRTPVDDPELVFSKGVLRRDVLALINGAAIEGINLATGEVVWRHDISSPASSYRCALVGGLDGRAVVFSDPTTKATVAIDTATGTVLWSRAGLSAIDRHGDAASVVLLAPLRTYTEEPIEGVDIATGTTRWTRVLRSTYAVPEPVPAQPGLAPMSVACGTP